MNKNLTLDLTRGPVLSHLVKLALPATIGYFFNTMYNVVDTFWAGKLSTDSLAGLSLNFSLIYAYPFCRGWFFKRCRSINCK